MPAANINDNDQLNLNGKNEDNAWDNNGVRRVMRVALVLGTPVCRKITGVNKIFAPKPYDSGLMAGDMVGFSNFDSCY